MTHENPVPRIMIADSIAAENRQAATEAAEAFQTQTAQDPLLVHNALNLSHYALTSADMAIEKINLSTELDKEHRQIVRNVIGLLALTENGRDIEFDEATEDALADDSEQRRLGFIARQAAGRQEFASLRRQASVASLVFFVRRVIEHANPPASAAAPEKGQTVA